MKCDRCQQEFPELYRQEEMDTGEWSVICEDCYIPWLEEGLEMYHKGMNTTPSMGAER